MLKYDFHKLLEPYEFQYFIRDILQIRENCFFESFKEGPDGGIDLRKKGPDDSMIVQVKRWQNNFPKFFYYLKKFELPKVQKLQPNRYILATSLSLTSIQKDKIMNLFAGYIKTPTDILSETDLNNLLGQEKYQIVALNYPSLWFQSGNVFFEKCNQMVNSHLYEEARAEYENIQETMKYYVPITQFSEMINHLKQNRYLLITGNPGIGKTSLARAISAYFIQHEQYQLIYTRNVEDANRVYDSNKKQIFFFDDFWGSCFKEKNMHFDEEKRLAEFIFKIEKSQNKILILTSRDYVLKQGLLNHLELQDVFYQNQYVLELKNYSEKLRTDIVLRHLHKSSLPFHYSKYISLHMKEIIYHPFFNPRVIEMYFNSGFHEETDIYRYYEFLLEDLESPFSFLEKVYRMQSKEAQLCLYLLLSIDDCILRKDLKELYLNALEVANQKGYSFHNFSLQNVLEQLEKNFIEMKYIETGDFRLTFLNPSIVQFLFEYKGYFEEFDRIIIESITYFKQALFFLKHEDPYFTMPLSNSLYQKLSEMILTRFDSLNLIKGTHYDSLYFHRMSSQEQTIYKIKYLLEIEDLDKDLASFSLDKFWQIIEALKKGDRSYIYGDSLPILINVISLVQKYDTVDGESLISLYYKNCIHMYELYCFSSFSSLFPQEYETFMKQENINLDERLKELALSDLEEYIQHKENRAFDDLTRMLENELPEIYDALYDKIVYYEKMDEKPKFIWDSMIDGDDEVNQADMVQKDLPDIEAYCQNEIYVKKNTDLDEFFFIKKAINLLPEEESRVLIKLVRKHQYVYLETLFDSEEYMDLVIQYFHKYKEMPESVTLFCKKLIYMIIEEENLDFKFCWDIIIGIGLESIISNESVFTMDLFHETFFQDIDVSKLHAFLDSKLFVRRGKWIAFIHPLLHFFSICYMLSYMDDEGKKDLYDEFLFAISPYNQFTFAFLDDFYYFNICAVELDADGFSRYFIHPLMQSLLEKIKANNRKETILSMIACFHMQIGLQSLNYEDLSCFCRSNIYFIELELLELLTTSTFRLQDYVSEDAFETFKDLFEEQIEIQFRDSCIYNISFEKLIENEKFYTWLEEYGIADKIMKMYQSLQVITQFCKHHSFYRFEDYQSYVQDKICQLEEK